MDLHDLNTRASLHPYAVHVLVLTSFPDFPSEKCFDRFVNSDFQLPHDFQLEIPH